jgi:hypothetical protein
MQDNEERAIPDDALQIDGLLKATVLARSQGVKFKFAF